VSVKQDWLWDRKITPKGARSVLKDPTNKHFLSLSSLLLSRKNSPEEVFRYYLKPVDFLQNWHPIKRQMRKDAWNDPRIEFWQAIYEKLKEKYKKKRIFIDKNNVVRRPHNEFCKLVAGKIKLIRKQKGLTQRQLAKRLKVSQQVISRIESGGGNISLLTLKNIVDTLGANLHLEIS